MLDGALLCYSLASNPPFVPTNAGERHPFYFTQESRIIVMCGFVYAFDCVDLLLLSHFAAHSSSLQAHDQNWVPACLPEFNPRAPLQVSTILSVFLV